MNIPSDRFMIPCHLMGVNFSPRAASEKTGIQFYRQAEVGEMEHIGKRKTIAKAGHASFEPPLEFQQTENPYIGLFWMIDTLTEHIDALRSCGADDIWIDLGVVSHLDVKLEFEPDFLMKLANLKIPFLISGYIETVDE
ncbi:hypothetical protein [Exiguobacterium sp. NG55]|uniref:hypothetical protein n=1 Tax=Exiguobacterium sp. NG55 TaxID=375477 RepID=UPI0004DF0DFE|nr:hypothetical protein [Exiguobacterium sp. NG55]